MQIHGNKYYVLFIFFIFHLAIELSVSIEVEVSYRGNCADAGRQLVIVRQTRRQRRQVPPRGGAPGVTSTL